MAVTATRVPGQERVADYIGWRRLVARLVDMGWQVTAGLAVWYAVDDSTEIEWGWTAGLAAAAICVAQTAWEPLTLWTLGTTPGKALMGLRVANARLLAKPTYRQALVRTIKLIGAGLGFWVLPGIGVVTFLAKRRRNSPTPFFWDRTGDGVIVEPARLKASVVSSALFVGGSLPAVSLLLAILWTAAADRAVVNPLATQELRRLVTGRWSWIHPLTGREFTLDSRWRLSSEELSLSRGVYAVTLAFGERLSSRVTVWAKWPSARRDPCGVPLLDLEDASFVTTEEIPSGPEEKEECHFAGGRGMPDDIEHFRLDGWSTSGVDYAVTRVWRSNEPETRAEVDQLAEALFRQAPLADVDEAGLRSYFWRNDLTRLSARIPRTWQHTETKMAANGTIEYTFTRLAPVGTQISTPALALQGVPNSLAAEFLENLVAELKGGLREVGSLTHNVLPTGETVLDFTSPVRHARMWTSKGRRFTWIAAWAYPDVRTASVEPGQHELLKLLLPTLK